MFTYFRLESVSYIRVVHDQGKVGFKNRISEDDYAEMLSDILCASITESKSKVHPRTGHEDLEGK